MRVIICGSSDFDDYPFMRQELDRLFSEVNKKKLTVVTGGQFSVEDRTGRKYGADYFAEQWACERYVYAVEIHRAEWKKHGKSAGMIRNSEMVSAGASYCIAFWNGYSPGTKDTIDKARKKGIEVRVILC